MKDETLLYDDGHHKCVMFSLEDEDHKEYSLSVNQFLIIQQESAVLIDPGISKRALKQCLDEAAPEAFIGIPLAHAARVSLGWARKSCKVAVTVGARRFPHGLLWRGPTLDELLQRHGHAIGCHGVRHLKAAEYCRQRPTEDYVRNEIQPQLDALRAAGIMRSSRNTLVFCSESTELIGNLL